MRLPKHIVIPSLAAMAVVAGSCGGTTTPKEASTTTSSAPTSAPSSAPSSTPGAASDWTVAQSAAAAKTGWLDGVDCLSATHCVAVGNESSSTGPTGALVETLDNGTWTSATAPAAPGSQGDYLFSVSCPALDACVAVGYFFSRTTTGGTGTVLIETLAHGKWSVTPTPKLNPEIQDSFLNGVSCATPANCVAVGDIDDGDASTDLPFMLTLARGTWSVTQTPSLGSQRGGLLAVSCTTPTSCAAVGYRTSSGTTKTLIETRTGPRWSLTASPGSGATSPNPGQQGLTAVSCPTAASCVAVGELSGHGPVIESPTGGRWSTRPSPSVGPDPGATGLYGVSCATATSCVAVGEQSKKLSADTPDGAFGFPLGPLIEHGSGATWSTSAAPTGVAPDSALHAVSCVGPSCVAVGQTGQITTPSSTVKTLIIQTS